MTPVDVAIQTLRDRLVDEETIKKVLKQLSGDIKNMPRLEIGRRGSNLRRLLKPYLMFDLAMPLMPVSQRTVYRYLDVYEYMVKNLPPAVIDEAMSRDIEIPSKKSNEEVDPLRRCFESLPAPKNPSRSKASEYLDKIEELLMEGNLSRTNQLNKVMSRCLRDLGAGCKRLPKNKKQRAKWLEDYFDKARTVVMNG